MVSRKMFYLFLLTHLFAAVLSAEVADKKQINILLLGKSGAGKSSLINILYNHLKKRRYEEEHFVVIPYVHNMKHIPVNVEEFKSFNIGTRAEAKSQTKEITPYRIELEGSDFDVVLLDSPGIPDTDGEEEDKKHLEKIRNQLANTPIHAVMVVQQVEDLDRSGTQLKQTMGAIFNNLPKSYSKNVAAMFTRTDPNSIDQDGMKANCDKFLAKLGTEDPDFKPTCLYLYGNSYFNRVPASVAGWAEDSQAVWEIIEKVKSNNATTPDEAFELNGLSGYLLGNVTELHYEIGNMTQARQNLRQTDSDLHSQIKRRERNTNYVKTVGVQKVRYEWTDCGWRGCTTYEESEAWCNGHHKEHSCYGGGGQSARYCTLNTRPKSRLEEGVCRKIDYTEYYQETNEHEKSEYFNALAEIEMLENSKTETTNRQAKLKEDIDQRLSTTVNMLTRRKELAAGSYEDFFTDYVKNKINNIEDNTFVDKDERIIILEPWRFLVRVYENTVGKVLDLKRNS